MAQAEVDKSKMASIAGWYFPWLAHLRRVGPGTGQEHLGVLTPSTPFGVSAGHVASFRVVKSSISAGHS
jgi:hypothetical protein